MYYSACAEPARSERTRKEEEKRETTGFLWGDRSASALFEGMGK
jgi:hypothetical protein